MPIPVACQCGQQFAANDQLAGQAVGCPACGRQLQIPNPQASAAVPVQMAPPAANAPPPSSTPSQAGPQAVRCVVCQMQFAAPAHLAGQVVPCPRCQSPIPVGTGQATITDDLFDELPSLEEQQEVLSAEQIKAQKRQRRKEQREREARMKKRVMQTTAVGASLLAAFGVVGFAIYGGVQLANHASALIDAFPSVDVTTKVMIIILLVGKGVGGLFGLMAFPLLLARNSLGRPLCLLACIFMCFGPISEIVQASLTERTVANLVIYELLAYFIIAGLLYVPGVGKYLGD